MSPSHIGLLALGDESCRLTFTLVIEVRPTTGHTMLLTYWPRSGMS